MEALCNSLKSPAVANQLTAPSLKLQRSKVGQAGFKP
jgi:hypothetical protein